jgi:hypothetical protein
MGPMRLACATPDHPLPALPLRTSNQYIVDGAARRS